MTRLSILFLLTFSFLLYCEQREVFYSDLANKDAPSPLVVFYDHVSTVTSCGVKCFNDNCCVRFIYSTISKQCMGVHVMESDVYFYQQAPSWSTEMQQFRKGKKKPDFWSTVFFFFYHIAIFLFFSSYCQLLRVWSDLPRLPSMVFRIHITTLWNRRRRTQLLSSAF